MAQILPIWPIRYCAGAAFFVPNAPEPATAQILQDANGFDIDDQVNGPVSAAPTIENAFGSAASEFNLPANAMALTGFSQGGMMSLHCGLHMQDKPGAIVSFSGALLVRNTLPKLAGPITSASQLPSSDIAYPHVQLVHGTEDPVVPFALMREARTILEEKGVEVETIARAGLAPRIDPDGLTAAIDFLARHLPAWSIPATF